MSVRRELSVAAALLVLAGCGASVSSSTESVPPATETPPATVGGVGVLPGPLPTQAIEEIASTTTIPVPESPERTVGALAAGNRVLMLGDSILASTSERYGNNMCNTLVPMGWEVAIEAEVSRDISFGNTVLDRVLDEGWDAGLVLLGNNYNGDEQRYLKELNEIVDRFEGKPVVVLTVTEFDETRREVNDVIRSLAEIHSNMIVVDWASMSRYQGVLAADGLHLTDGGREVLAQVVAPQFDTAPEQPGKCLNSVFSDDSAGSVDGPTGTTKPSSGVRPTTTTVRPSTPTTTKPSGSTTTSPGGSSTTTPTVTTSPTGTTSPSTATTAPATTSPPATQVPTTAQAPVTTQPPPPPTAAPTTAAPVVTTAAPEAADGG